MTKVVVVIGGDWRRKMDPADAAEADMVIALNEECSEGKLVKDRFGKEQPVKVVS